MSLGASVRRAMGAVLAALVIALQATFAQSPIANPQQPVPAEFSRLWNEAKRLDLAGKLSEAAANGEKAAAALRSVQKNHPAELASIQQWLSELYERQGRYAAAKQSRAEVLEIQTGLFGKEDWRVTDARLALAHAQRMATMPSPQRRHLQMAAERCQAGSRLLREGKPAEAAVAMQAAVETQKVILGESHREYAANLSLLGSVSMALGDDARAERLFHEAVEIEKKTLGVDHPVTAEGLTSLAGLYERLGSLKTAEPLFRQALEINRKVFGESHASTAASMSRLASLHVAQLDFAQAEPLLRQALEIHERVFGPATAQTGESLRSLGGLYTSMGSYDRALPMLRRAVDTLEKTRGAEHPETAAALSGLARLYLLQGDTARAELIYQMALGIRKKSLGPAHEDYARNLSELAAVHAAGRERGKAEALLREALDISLANLELAASTQSERQQLAMAERARQSLNRYLAIAAEGEDFRESAYRKLLAWKGSVLTRQRAMQAARSDPEVRTMYGELQPVVGQLAWLAFAIPASDIEDLWQQRIVELSRKKEGLERILAKKTRRYRDAQRDPTLEDLRGALPADAVLIDFAECRAEPPPGNATEASLRLQAFLVRREGPIELVTFENCEQIHEHVDRWRADTDAAWSQVALGGPPGPSPAGAWLREHLWQPLEDRLAGAKTVLVSPDGALGKLAFAALPGKQPESFLLEEWEIAVVPAPQALPELLNRTDARKTTGKFLLFDAIDEVAGATEGKTGGSETALAAKKETQHFGLPPGAPSQLDLLKNLYQKQFGADSLTLLDAGHATEDAFRLQTPEHRQVHVIAHGFFGGDEIEKLLSRSTYYKPVVGDESLVTSHSLAKVHPNFLSGIMLANEKRRTSWSDDGKLTAAEVQLLDLRGVDLLVLSSCQTALGEQATGEGLLGLQRAFQVAGAKTVVSTLWNVQVAATTDLMARFYENLWTRRMGKLAALREAQLWMLREHGFQGLIPPSSAKNLESESRPRLPPYFWAGFVLSGDWR